MPSTGGEANGTDVVGAGIAGLPFAGGWIGGLAYELGEVWEPAARLTGDPRAVRGALARWHRCDDALLFDHETGAWWAIGEPPIARIADTGRIAPEAFEVAPLRSRMGRPGYIAAVQRGIEYIRAGDVYQVNLAHELEGAFTGSMRTAFARLAAAAAPGYGAYIEDQLAGGERMGILSASPELFLSFDPRERRLVTRPMKGTRPGAGSEQELAAASKDRAELNMIIDLMRNDLGRVCEFGSIRVDHARTIERHGRAGPGSGASGDVSGGGTEILQATGTVSGRVRNGIGMDDVLRATFPGGSVTGAPKVRAMQIIAELEPSRRGVYCGGIGYISDCGRMEMSIGIRTAVVRGRAGAAGLDEIADGTLSYSIGAGIVADSDPIAEWEETLVKAAAIRGIAAIRE
ncbi:MAG: anthranilate synthase component I family protein [Phycisphaerales bacterium]|nr:anthranilate synthase component I family protein [Phycisphaerales bacterium]